MSKALYTKYRPQTFEEVIGQDVAVQILQKSIKTERVNHAYLFYGIRGTGKTTLARLFAKTINCTSPLKENPCNECESCKTINKSAQIDVIEMDAASNNGVDEIRDLTEKANYTTASSKYKVYIIDEVHMLSKSAFNALLKTLEEPPSNTIFLLATTEINRIPDTILSRTVVLNLQLVRRGEITQQLINILNKEEKKYEENALEYIATLSEGSVRDAISYLQTALLYDDVISKKNVIKVLGVTDIEKLEQELLSEGDVNLLIDESMNGRRLMIILIDLLIKLISRGRHEFKQLLSKLTDGFIAIKDPMLLNKFITSVLMEVEIKTSPITESEAKRFDEELEIKIEETIEFKVEEIFKKKLSIQDILRTQQQEGTKEARMLLEDSFDSIEPTIESPIIEETVELKEPTIESPIIEETIELKEPTIESPIIEETVELKEPTIESPIVEETVELKEPTIESPVVEETVELKEPTIESPIVEETVELKEPTIESPIVEETVELKEPTIESPVVEETDELKEPTIESPIVEETVELKEPTIESPVVEETVELKEPTIESPIVKEPQEIEKLEEPINEPTKPEVEQQPFNFNSKDYVWTMLNGDDMSLSTVMNKWILLRTVDTNPKQQAIANLLLESKPLIATKESVILGMEDDYMIDELKKEVNSELMEDFLKQIFGRPIILMPTNSNNWSKLIGVAKQVRENNIEIEFSLNPKSFFKKEKDQEAELARNLFGDKLVSE